MLSLVDVDDWTKHTDYRSVVYYTVDVLCLIVLILLSGYDINDQVIKWFWQCIRSWPPERKSRLLQFATGTSRSVSFLYSIG